MSLQDHGPGSPARSHIVPAMQAAQLAQHAKRYSCTAKQCLCPAVCNTDMHLHKGSSVTSERQQHFCGLIPRHYKKRSGSHAWHCSCKAVYRLVL